MREVRAVWVLLAAELAAVLVTYSRLPASHLYSVTGSGLGAGLSRIVVELNFPDGLIAIAVLGVTLPRPRLLAAAAAVMCAVTVYPGVVSQHDLDARWINAIPALGVALAAVLSLRAPGPVGSRPRGDRLRIALAGLCVVVAAPWIAAALGFYLDGVPVLGWLFETGRLVSFHDPLHHAVHHGVHHGLQGLLFVLAALLLSRVSNRISLYLALMLTFGVANMANDGWLEQVVERGWSSSQVPSVLGFYADWTWAVAIAAALAVWLTWFGGRRASAAGRDAGAAPRPPTAAAPPS